VELAEPEVEAADVRSPFPLTKQKQLPPSPCTTCFVLLVMDLGPSFCVVVSIGAIDVLFLFVLMIFKYQNKKNTRCLIIIIFSSFAFNSKNNNILEIDTTLNNEASVLQSFF
jgi:NADH:ubiquinone oxidoreductase subunit 6 (subunit J)